MSKRIAIVGAGTAGLQLGLYLLAHGVRATLFCDKRPEEYRHTRLLNTVAHHHVTIERENELECNHWPTEQFGYFGHHYYVGTPEPLQFFGSLRHPSRAVDYRIYQPRLIEDFAARGGTVAYRPVEHADLAAISQHFDLMVVCTGKGPFGNMFARELEYSPFDEPQRALCVGLFKGIREPEQRAVSMYFSPGAGEMIEIPTLTFGGMANALVIENHIGGDLEILARMKYDDDPNAFMTVLLEKIREHYPTCAERIDEREFALAGGPLDILQGGVTPAVRHGFATLENGSLAVALGDVQSIVDPVLGQGANMASYAAFILGEKIVENDIFDDRFVEKVDAARGDRVLSAARWTNYVLWALESGASDFMQFIEIISRHPAIVDEFTDNFNYPERQWDCFASSERIAAWLEARLPEPPLAAAV